MAGGRNLWGAESHAIMRLGTRIRVGEFTKKQVTSSVVAKIWRVETGSINVMTDNRLPTIQESQKWK